MVIGTSVFGANQAGLVDPVFLQEDTFNITIYRRGFGAENQVVTKQPPSTHQVPTKYPPSSDETLQEFQNSSVEVRNLIKVLVGEKSRQELQDALELKDRGHFRENYIDPALVYGFIRLKYPENPKHPKQRYLLTNKGQELLNNL